VKIDQSIDLVVFETLTKTEKTTNEEISLFEHTELKDPDKTAEIGAVISPIIQEITHTIPGVIYSAY
jgi:hypothetical protein